MFLKLWQELNQITDPSILEVKVTEYNQKVNELWDKIANHCESRSIAPSAITSKRELGPLIGAALDGKPIPQLPVNTGWRKQLLGELVADEALIVCED